MTGNCPPTPEIRLLADRPISVAILAGGRSSRMGFDKALVRLQPHGPTLLERVIAATQSLTDDCIVVSREEGNYPGFGVAVRGDLYPGTGVLGGIGTALRCAAHDKVLIVSCDMPFLSTAALAWMASLDSALDAVVPVTRQPSRQGGSVTYQTLHAIYGRSCIPAIESELDAGNRKAVSFYNRISIRNVTENEVARFDPDLLTFMSVNTPESLQLARAVDLARIPDCK